MAEYKKKGGKKKKKSEKKVALIKEDTGYNKYSEALELLVRDMLHSARIQGGLGNMNEGARGQVRPFGANISTDIDLGPFTARPSINVNKASGQPLMVPSGRLDFILPLMGNMLPPEPERENPLVLLQRD